VSELERRYRRLLDWYPRGHRERNGEEMLGVLMAGAGDRRRPGWRESADLLWGAARLHLRWLTAADGGVDSRDVMAIVSLLAPMTLIAGATTGLHELGWWVRAGALSDMSWQQQFPDAPVWAVWLAVAVLGLRGFRRAAAVGAGLGTAGFGLLAVLAPFQHWWNDRDAGWVLLGLVTTIALASSSGPSHGRRLVGQRAIAMMVVTVVAVVVIGTVGSHVQAAQWLQMAVLVGGVVASCGVQSRVGRRAALVLLLPVVTTLLAKVLLAVPGSFAQTAPTALVIATFYGVPLMVLLTLGCLPRRSLTVRLG